MEEKEHIIQLKKNESIKIFKIYDENGNDTGEFLKFNLDDIEMPFKVQELYEQDKKNRQWLKNQLLIIEKRQDVKGNEFWTKNQKDKFKVMVSFLKREEEIYNIFLGENGVKKLLNGDELSWDSLDTIDNYIQECVLPELSLKYEDVTSKIKEKYKDIVENKDEVIQ